MSAILKIIIGIILLLSIAWLGIFVYNKYRGGNTANPAPTPANGGLPYNPSMSDEKEVKTLAENFVRIYKTYQLGDFSGLENLKDQMTVKLWQEKAEWIAVKKREMEKQPKKYITYWAFTKETTVLLQNNNETNIEVRYLQRELRGAIIQGPVTIEWIDENGQKNANIASTDSEKKAVLKIVKENGSWKVDTIIIK